VEAVEDVEGVGAVLGDQVEVGLPHVGADELDLPGQLAADQREELLEALEGAILADPEQADHAGLDLVDQRQVLMAAAVLDLVDADRADRIEGAPLQAPFDDPLHGLIDLLPAGAEGPGGLLPG